MYILRKEYQGRNGIVYLTLGNDSQWYIATNMPRVFKNKFYNKLPRGYWFEKRKGKYA